MSYRDRLVKDKNKTVIDDEFMYWTMMACVVASAILLILFFPK